VADKSGGRKAWKAVMREMIEMFESLGNAPDL